MQLGSIDNTSRSANLRIGLARFGLGVVPCLVLSWCVVARMASAAEVTGDPHSVVTPLPSNASPGAVPTAPAETAEVSDAIPPAEIRLHGDPSRELDPAAVEPEPLSEAEALARITPERIDSDLIEIRLLVERAHYRTALAIAAATREVLDENPSTREFDERRAELEVLCATSEIALGREDAALERMRAALGADPELELDAKATSPKVRDLLERARGDTRPTAAAVSTSP